MGLTAQWALAQEYPRAATLFENVQIFDGTSEELSEKTNVLVVDNIIKVISTEPIIPKYLSVTTINGEGRVLMPGLIDAHVHLYMATLPPELSVSPDMMTPEELEQNAEKAATDTLMRGFTSVRDMAGPVFNLKRAIDAGKVVGPRIYPSGAMISQTSGHGDYRTPADLPRTPTSPLSPAEELGIGAIADGVPEVLRATREQLMKGASQIKLAAGGGVSSNYDPLDVSQYTEAEFSAAVEAAEDWGTYVTVHAYTPRAIQKAIRAGVKCIEHGQLMDEETAKIMQEKDIWLSLQPFLDDEDANPQEGEKREKQLLVAKGTDIAYNLAKEYNLKTAWGTDTLFSAKLAARQGAKLAKLERWYTSAEVLKMATSTNAQLLAMSGLRNPYPGKLGVVKPEDARALGVVKEDALADLLLVDGNPLEDIKLIEDPAQNFVVIMKDGKIYKNKLPASDEGDNSGEQVD
ncbi:amidohydrolase family protein [Coleofasciculus chthonoplastes]|uniref:amidohydrolase family protein n=1 Tax=Coleofasciculus chthonoplastes TaxID=64178 RepID=UPI0040646902